MTERTNRPHFHVWVTPRGTDRMMYRWARPFGSQQAASKYARHPKRGLDPDRFIVRQCWNPKCSPRLD